MSNLEETSAQASEIGTETGASPVTAPEPQPLTQPVELNNVFKGVHERAAERKGWQEEKLVQALKAIEAIRNEQPGTQIRVNGMIGHDYEGITRTNNVFYKLSEELRQSIQYLIKDNIIYARVLPAGQGVYIRDIQDVGKPGFLGGQKMRVALDVIRADSIDDLRLDNIEGVLKDESLEQAPKGDEMMGIGEFLKTQRKIGAELEEGYEGPSKVAIMLRCIGHSAANTLVENEDELELPPVNPWKLTKSLAKAVLNKEERRAMIARVKEDSGLPGSLLMLVMPGLFMRGDLLGYLAMPELYKMAKEEGLSDSDAAADVIIRLASPNLPKDQTERKVA